MKPKTEGERIHLLRTRLGLSQKDFAKKISIGQGLISEIERGIKNASVEILKNLLLKFNYNPIYHLTGKGDVFTNKDEIKISLIEINDDESDSSTARTYSKADIQKMLEENEELLKKIDTLQTLNEQLKDKYIQMNEKYIKLIESDKPSSFPGILGMRRGK